MNMERQRRLTGQVGEIDERLRRRPRRRKRIQDYDEMNENEDEEDNIIMMITQEDKLKPKLSRPKLRSHLIVETTIRLAFTISLILSLSLPKLAGGQSIAILQQSMAQQLQVFSGNESQATDSNHFKLLERQGDFVLVGAR